MWTRRTWHLGAEAHLFGALDGPTEVGPRYKTKGWDTQISFVTGLKTHSRMATFAATDQESALLPRDER